MKRVWPKIDYNAVSKRARFMRRAVPEFKERVKSGNNVSIAMRGFGLSERRVRLYKEGINAFGSATEEHVADTTAPRVVTRKEATDVTDYDVATDATATTSKSVVELCSELAEKVRRGEIRPVSSYEAGAARRKRWARWVGNGSSSDDSSTDELPEPPVGNDVLLVLQQIETSPETVMRRAVSEVRLPQVVVDACINACVETGRLVDGAALAEVCAIHGTDTAATDAGTAAVATVDARGVVERPSKRAVSELVKALVRAGDGRRARHVTEAMAK